MKSARDVGLSLSGGGYRAAMFHLGSLLRLSEAGLLPRLRTVSSVSGGSIVAGFLGMRWGELIFNDDGVATNFSQIIIDPMLGFTGKGLDVAAVLRSGFIPGLVSR
jgi:NTE family protein